MQKDKVGKDNDLVNTTTAQTDFTRILPNGSPFQYL